MRFINNKRENSQVIPVVTRRDDVTYGIRAKKDLGWGQCFFSLFLPWHNEWINCWLYLGFALYFWIECIFIMAKSQKDFDFNNDWDYFYMFIVTFALAVSLTATFFYYLIYSISAGYLKTMYSIHLAGIYVIAYSATFAFVSSEDANTPICFFIQFLAPCLLIGAIVLVCYNDLCRTIAFWVTFGFILLILVVDLSFFSSHR